MTELFVYFTTGIGMLLGLFCLFVIILWCFIIPFKILAMKRNSDLILKALTGTFQGDIPVSLETGTSQGNASHVAIG